MTWNLVRTALIFIHTRKPHDWKNVEEKEGTCRAVMGIVAKPNNENPLPLQTEEKTTSETAGVPPSQAQGKKFTFKI